MPTPEFETRLVDQENIQREANWAAVVQRASRLAIVDNLRRHFELPHDIDPKSDWIRHEAEPRQPTASIGIELELWWSHILPAELAEILTSGRWQDLTIQEKQAFNEEAEPIGYPHQERCKQTLALGIPSRGSDGLWEFSHHPAWHYQTLVEEVRLLSAAELVPDNKSIPLHITLGGVATDANMRFLLRMLEVAGSSSVERLSAASTDSGWARRGTAGVASRAHWKLELNQPCGVELRTLLYQNPQQLEQLLAWTQCAGSLLIKVQAGDGEATASWQSFVSLAEAATGIHLADTDWINPFVSRQRWEDYVDRLSCQNREVTTEIQHLLSRFVV